MKLWSVGKWLYESLLEVLGRRRPFVNAAMLENQFLSFVAQFLVLRMTDLEGCSNCAFNSRWWNWGESRENSTFWSPQFLSIQPSPPALLAEFDRVTFYIPRTEKDSSRKGTCGSSWDRAICEGRKEPRCKIGAQKCFGVLHHSCAPFFIFVSSVRY
jgi:hypothetical protein